MSKMPVRVERFKFPQHIKPYEIPLYGGSAYFTTSREEFVEIRDYMMGTRESIELAEYSAGCMTHGPTHDGRQGYLVGVFDGTMNTYVHEISHLAIFILDRAGVPINDFATEAFAYLIGTLAEQWEPDFIAGREKLIAEQKAAERKEAKEKAAKKTAREQKAAKLEVDKPAEKAPAAAKKGEQP